MEFFRYIDRQIKAQDIQDKIGPENVADFAETMLFLNYEKDYFNGVTLWGEFQIGYDKIKGGVRFSLLDCPNAVTWTITTGFPPERNKIVLHSTINRTQKPTEFLDEYMEFLDEWEAGLNTNFK